MSVPVTAIFDIGKTNKKFFLFDANYKIAFENSASFSEITDEDGYPCEDITKISEWVLSTLADALSKKEFTIKQINFSAHGASFVHVDEQGKIVAPLYNYFKPFPESLRQQFNNTYNIETICVETASPDLGNLNSGMQLYWLKYQRPEIFNKIKYSLHLPEYFCFLLTGQFVSGITSIGCHTFLWDFQKNNYHAWVKHEAIDQKLAPICASTQSIPFLFNKHELTCGIGLHDSSAALIPYLKSITEPFVLLSTGTWNISLNPFNASPLTPDELTRDCLCYLTYRGSQVKASRLLAGGTYDEQVKQLAEKFNLSVDYFNRIEPEKIDLQSKGEWGAADQAYHQLVSTIVQQQKASTDLVLKNSTIKKILVEGGFAKNQLFITLLSRAYPTLVVESASMPQASALGAAMIVNQGKES